MYRPVAFKPVIDGIWGETAHSIGNMISDSFEHGK